MIKPERDFQYITYIYVQFEKFYIVGELLEVRDDGIVIDGYISGYSKSKNIHYINLNMVVYFNYITDAGLKEILQSSKMKESV